MRTITLEEHYATPAFLKSLGREPEERAETATGFAAGLVEALLDLGANRIGKMDEGASICRLSPHRSGRRAIGG